MNIETMILVYAPWLSGFSTFMVAHPYIIVFVGLLIGGETVLLPAIYLALAGPLQLSYITALMILATVVSDIIWYYIGLGSLPFLSRRKMKPRVQKAVTDLSHMFRQNDSFVLFTSKFVYGTRIAAQVLCGMHRMNFRKYLVVNTAGVLAIMATYTFVIYSVIEAVNSLGTAKYRIHITFVIILTVLIIFQLIIKHFFKKNG